MDQDNSFEERKEKEVPKKEVKEKPTLYHTVNKIYNMKKPVSRVLYLAKTKESDSKDEKENNKIVINNIEEEVKTFFSGSEIFNCMIIFSSVNYCTVVIESSSEKILDYLKMLNIAIKQRKSSHVSVNIISYTEDNPVSLIPTWYRAETNLNDGTGYGYKDKTAIEKGWIIYDKYCDLGRQIKNLQNTSEDVTKLNNSIKQINNSFLFFPNMDEIKEFTGREFINIDYFVKLYINFIDVELDEDIVWPLQWHLNA